METNKNNLMKHFASVLRNRALGKQQAPEISKTVAQFLSRKELIDIIKKKFDGTIPKEHNLLELENEELLELIGEEMFIISHITEKWSKEPIETKVIPPELQQESKKKPEPSKVIDKGKNTSQKPSEIAKKS